MLVRKSRVLFTHSQQGCAIVTSVHPVSRFLSQALQKYYKEAQKGAGSKLTAQDTANACMDMVTAACIGMEGFKVYEWNDLGPNFRAHVVKEMGQQLWMEPGWQPPTESGPPPYFYDLATYVKTEGLDK